MPGDFTILDHPADLGIEARGKSLAEAFEHAAMGLMSIILDLQVGDPRQQRTIDITGSDHQQLLVKWLSEILYLFDGQRFVSRDFEITDFSATHLRATVHGEPFSTVKHRAKLDVKAITYHQIAVHEDSTGARVRVFLDI